MKKINLEKKLQLHRETVRALTSAQLRDVVGGKPVEEPKSEEEVCTFAEGNQCGTARKLG